MTMRTTGAAREQERERVREGYFGTFGGQFVPETLTVQHGAHVRVTNSDGAPHTVTADDGHSFDSGTVATDASATIRVAKTGHFAYHCTIHPYMKGELVVE